jgi:DNA-binding MarR family transcriptional regulator
MSTTLRKLSTTLPNPADDGAALRSEREQILLRLLLRATRHMTIETVARMRARGHDTMQPSFPRFLGNLDTQGTRLGALARRMGASRQAVSQQLVEVEAAGLVERLPDPTDRRGVIVRFTPKGRRTLSDAIEVMNAIEAEYSAIIGTAAMQHLKRSLKRLLDHVDTKGEFGLD